MVFLLYGQSRLDTTSEISICGGHDACAVLIGPKLPLLLL